MFGRKKKKEEEDPLGLSSIGSTASVVPASSQPMAFTSGMQFGTSDALKAMFTGKGPVGDLIKEIQADPQAFREQMMAQAQAAGVSTFVMTPQGFQQTGAASGAPAPTHVDVIDELTKAADLHDRGALTDAEFEALKHKLLGH